MKFLITLHVLYQKLIQFKWNIILKKLFDDPITISSGYTYEKKHIEKHIKENGNIDPQNKFSKTIELIFFLGWKLI